MLTRAIALALIAMLCASCGFKPEPTGPLPAFPTQVRDALGRQIHIENAPERIVSLDPGMTAAMYSLGVQKLLVGRSGAETYPKGVKSVPVMLQKGAIDTHALRKARADLILAPASLVGTAAQAKALESKVGALVYVVGASSIDRVETDIGQLGLMTNTAVKARQLAASIRARVAAVQRAVKGQPPARTFVDIGLRYTIDPTGLTADLLRTAGGVNVAADSDTSTPVSKTDMRTLAPEVYLSQEGDGATLQNLKASKGLSTLPAVASGRVIQLPASVLTEDGPRIAQALAAIAKALHPGIVIPAT
jgi:iron complex transport system substrate-binding protein